VKNALHRPRVLGVVLVAVAGGCGASSSSAPPPAEESHHADSRAAPPEEPKAEPKKEVDKVTHAPIPAQPTPPTFADDLAFLNAHDKPIVLTDADGAKVALSAAYQGRVMTSAASEAQRSLGWINRGFIAAGRTGTQFDNYGGEDRFWLGPEAGQFGLYFPPGKPFTFDLWQTPHALQEGAWDVKEQKADQVTFHKAMTVESWSKVDLAVDVTRTARLLSRDEAKKVLGLAAPPPKGVGFVAYETKNRIVNAGKAPWTKGQGTVSIWILSMFAPAADGRVIVPFETNAPKGAEIVNDRYFGKIPKERLSIHEDKGFLTLVADGKQRGKIGLGPLRAKSVLGSYSAEAKLLTIVHYDGPKKGAPYVNSMWEQQKEPFKGDVVNSYNDGPPAPDKPALGGFYEIETSSPAAELAPGKDMVHTHRVFHFVGGPEMLEPIAKAVLGVSLADLSN
jgi:hypothetical protein